MLDATIRDTYLQLKASMDAAYTLLKKEPSVINATRHTAAVQAFNTFCIKTMKTLVGSSEEGSDKRQEILANIEEYKTCNTCGSQILYPVDASHYIESSDFVPDFPGWCHTCLVEHCCDTDCRICRVTAGDPAECPFKEIKKLYLED